LYLRRAQRMVSMEFLDILREITPDGVHQAETIFGVRQESD
jgi:type VI secretion system protein ImpA